jgi:hypothetical protein
MMFPESGREMRLYLEFHELNQPNDLKFKVMLNDRTYRSDLHASH